MSDIKLTHSPDQCCECVPHLEASLARVKEENANLLAEQTKLNWSSLRQDNSELKKERDALRVSCDELVKVIQEHINHDGPCSVCEEALTKHRERVGK